MSLRIINATEVRELLPMNRCVDVMAEAMQAASAGTVAVPPRIIMPLVDESGFLGVMPGSASAPKVYGTKVFSLHPGNPTEGRPAVQGFVALFDHDTGTPTAIVDGAEITAIRTAAASALATRYLARPDAQSHGVFGTGVQAVTHIEAIATVADLDQVVVWGRSADKAEALAAEQGKKTGLRIRACRDPQEAAACDIVSVVTGAVEPVVRAAWVRSGAHVNLVGAHTPSTREADSDLIAAGSVFVDLKESALNEAGDILIPMGEGRFDESHIRGEIGRVVAGELHGRQSDEEITIYNSLGITAQDLYAAHAVLVSALKAGIGEEVDL